MRVRLGDLPQDPGFLPESERLHGISDPSLRMSYLLATLAGVMLVCLPLTLLMTLSVLSTPAQGPPEYQDAPTPWAAILLTFLLYVPVHEALHAACYPDFGLSERSTLAIWPSKVRFGVYYEGGMTRTRWLLMRAMPLVVLTLLPLCVLAWINAVPWTPIDRTLRMVLEFLMILNALGSGGDAVAMLLVLRQVPASASLVFRSGRAYWR